MKPNLSQKAMKLAPNDNYSTEEHHIYTFIHYIQSYKQIRKLFFCYQCANFVPVLACIVHMNMQSLE